MRLKIPKRSYDVLSLGNRGFGYDLTQNQKISKEPVMRGRSGVRW